LVAYCRIVTSNGLGTSAGLFLASLGLLLRRGVKPARGAGGMPAVTDGDFAAAGLPGGGWTGGTAAGDVGERSGERGAASAVVAAASAGGASAARF